MSVAGEALVAAVRALLPAGFTHYQGEAEGSPAAPWIVSSVGVPDSTHRSEGAHASAGDLDVYITVAGESEGSARVVLTAVTDALAGAAVVAVGWSVGRLIEYQRPRIYATDVELAGQSRHLFTGVVGYRATCSRMREN